MGRSFPRWDGGTTILGRSHTQQRQDVGRFWKVKEVLIAWRRGSHLPESNSPRLSLSQRVIPASLFLNLRILNPSVQEQRCQDARRKYQPLWFFAAGPCSHHMPQAPKIKRGSDTGQLEGPTYVLCKGKMKNSGMELSVRLLCDSFLQSLFLSPLYEVIF